MFHNDFIKKTPPAAILFVSGAGSNAEKLLSSKGYGTAWTCAAVVTDKPESSRAFEIAEKFSLPFVPHDISAFYASHGLASTSIATAKGIEVRSLWTDCLKKKISRFAPDFGIMAGFISLSNIVAEFPCLNVHPGDLLVEENGKRVLVGLHTRPVEAALLRGCGYLRSSVIIVEPYTPGAKEMDSGLIPGISEKIPVRLPDGVSTDDLRRAADSRTELGRHSDILAKVAAEHLERLKTEGDWNVFPQVVENFAKGLYSRDENGGLLFRLNRGSDFMKVVTVEYSPSGAAPVFSRGEGGLPS